MSKVRLHEPSQVIGHRPQESALPVDQDGLDALALELFKIDLNLKLICSTCTQKN